MALWLMIETSPLEGHHRAFDQHHELQKLTVQDSEPSVMVNGYSHHPSRFYPASWTHNVYFLKRTSR